MGNAAGKDDAAAAADFLISDLPEVFGDLERIPQDDGPAAVCQIDYPAAFAMAFDYFRAILRIEEYSWRALRLTTLCLQQNPANYTVWHYRRLCLYALKDDTDLHNGLKAELKWTTLVGGDNPKNYQIWYHRRALLEAYYSKQQQQQQQPEQPQMKDIGTAELEYIGTVLQVDGKNYHAWSHRQWMVNKIMTVNDVVGMDGCWLAEMDYAAKLLETDVRNNSAWNHRWFAIHGLAVKRNQNNDSDSLVLSLELARDELEFCLTQARLDLHNESPFRYLLALIKEQVKELQRYDGAQATSLLVEYHDKVANLEAEQTALVSVTDVASSGLDADGSTITTSRFITGTLVDLLEWQGDAASLAQATTLLDDLATKQDPIRCKYWNLRQQRIILQQQQSSAS